MPQRSKRKDAKDGVKEGNKGTMNEMGFQRVGKKESGVL